MPGFDGTGPRQRGAMTGRGDGYCAVEVPRDAQDDRLFPRGLHSLARLMRLRGDAVPGAEPRRLRVPLTQYDADMLIRDASATNAAAIAVLISELAQSIGESSTLSVDFINRYLAEGGNILLAEADSQVVGMLSYSTRLDLYHAAPTALIEELIVTADHRGQGIGSALMEVLLKRLHEQGCAEVSVTTMPDNADAIRFYQSHGLTDEALYLEKHF